jgi:hypothetical protein
MIVPAEKLHLNRLCGTSMYSKVLGGDITCQTKPQTSGYEIGGYEIGVPCPPQHNSFLTVGLLEKKNDEIVSIVIDI